MKQFEAELLAHGVVCRYVRDLNVTVMMKKPGFVLTSNMMFELPEVSNDSSEFE